MPIIVGGTNYYIEALLWDFLIDKQVSVCVCVCASGLLYSVCVYIHMCVCTSVFVNVWMCVLLCVL